MKTIREEAEYALKVALRKREAAALEESRNRAARARFQLERVLGRPLHEDEVVRTREGQLVVASLEDFYFSVGATAYGTALVICHAKDFGDYSAYEFVSSIEDIAEFVAKTEAKIAPNRGHLHQPTLFDLKEYDLE